MPVRRPLALLVLCLVALAGCGGSDSEGGADGSKDRAAAKAQRAKLNGADTPDPAAFPRPKDGETFQQLAGLRGTPRDKRTHRRRALAQRLDDRGALGEPSQRPFDIR